MLRNSLPTNKVYVKQEEGRIPHPQVLSSAPGAEYPEEEDPPAELTSACRLTARTSFKCDRGAPGQ